MTFFEPAAPQTRQRDHVHSELPAPVQSLADTVPPEVVRYFLASARCGCFSQAARSLNVKTTLLRKRLLELEEQVHCTLFIGQGRTLVLSPAGEQLQALLIARDRRLPQIEQPLIRLAVAEPILHDILGRDLIALLRRNASVRLEIISLDGKQALQTVEADLVLWLSGMESPDPGPSFHIQPAKPLACLNYLPHIAKRYSRQITRPETLEDLIDYMLVQWQPDRHIEALRPWNTLVEQRLSSVVQVNDYSLMLEMIRCGGCIGLLPRYMSSFDRDLIALPGLLPDTLQRRAWMAVNAEGRHPEAVQMLVDLIVSTFESRKDWFVSQGDCQSMAPTTALSRSSPVR